MRIHPKQILSICLCLVLILFSVYFGPRRLHEGAYMGYADGFGGTVSAAVTVDGNVITDIQYTAANETPEVGGAAIRVLKDEILDSQSISVDAVSGATYSSEAFLSAVGDALDEAGVTLSGSAAVAEDIEKDADIVVVGGGGAGMTAAITAAEAGRKVLLIEKSDILGGNTTRASSGMNAAETHYEEEQGVEDSVELYIEDTMKGGKELNDPELVRYLAENSNDAVDWLDNEGAKLDGPLTTMGGLSAKRTHRPVDEEGKVIAVGSYIVGALSERMNELGIEVITGTEVTSIIMENGKASGVTGKGKSGNSVTIHSKAVIVATGGFGGSLDMITSYRPDLEGYISTNVPSATGDAVKFLGDVNADFVDMDQIQLHPTVIPTNGTLVGEALRGDGAILVNKEGKRFTNETGTRDAVSAAEIAQTDGNVWLIVNQEMYEGSSVIEKLEKGGYLVEGDDTDKLAEAMGFDDSAAGALKQTLTTWTSYVKNNEDPEFGRTIGEFKTDLSSGPYYAVNVAPGIHHCMGGVKIDTDAHVIDKSGTPIPGLYAAGEVTGGVHGANRLGGNAVADIVVFGHRAGEMAATEID